MGQGPTKAPLRFIYSLVLMDSLDKIFGLVDSALSDGALSIDHSGIEVGVELIVRALKVRSLLCQKFPK